MRTTISRTTKVALGIALLLAVGGVAAASTNVTMDDNGSAKLAFHAPWLRAAAFHDDNGTVKGRFVAFDADPSTGTLRGYTLVRDIESRALFDSVSLGAPTKAIQRGPAYALRGDNVTLVAFDAPNAGLDVVARNGATITLVAADGVSLEKHAADPGWSREGVLLRVGNATARLVVNNGSHVDVSGQTITVTLGAKGRMEMVLEGHPAQRMAEHRALERAFARRNA